MQLHFSSQPGKLTMSTPLSFLEATVQFDRRKFLAVAGAFVAAGVLSPRAMALAGPFTMKQGAYDLMVVSDGDLALPMSVFGSNASPEDLKALFAAAGITTDTVPAAVSPVILKSGSDMTLFDTGGKFAPTNGKLMENLKLAGIDPAAITKVVFTHGHGDHLFGVGAGGVLNFPNATHYVAGAEWDFWMKPDLKSGMPEAMHGMIDGIVASFGAIKDKVQRFAPGDEVLPGVKALDTAGHSPGHVSFEVAGGDGLIIMGDVANSVVSGFAHPEWHFGFDAVPEQASATRKAILARSAADKIKLLGYHWPSPGIGVAIADGAAFKYEPAV